VGVSEGSHGAQQASYGGKDVPLNFREAGLFDPMPNSFRHNGVAADQRGGMNQLATW
jgi:hypothetical protein